MTNLKPYGDRVIAKKIKADEKTASGIILSNSSKDKTNKALVVASNHDDVKAGENIILTNNAGTPVKDNGEDYLIVKVCDIIAVVDND